jgi:Secretion system C-terminal sorting domain
VQVRACVAGVWGLFGVACQAIVTGSPSTKLRTQYCGITLNSVGTDIYCDPFFNATRYRYHIIDIGLGTDYFYTTTTNSTKFIPQWVPQITYGGNYSIEISMELNGVFGSYGPACGLTISGVPNTQIRTAYCNWSSSTPVTTIYCDPVATAIAYEYEITNVTNGGTIFKTQTGTTAFYPHLVSGIVNNCLYSIRVRAILPSTSGSFGSSCSLTLGTPSSRLKDPSLLTVASEENTAVLNVYPNPSNGNIKLETNRTGTYFIIDELGKVLRTVEITDINTIASVENLASGVYTVISNQPDGFIRQKIVVTK